MKLYKYLLLPLFFVIVCAFHKQKNTMQLVKLNDTLFIDKYEISNNNWKVYLASLQEKYGKGSKEYQNALPDTLIWKEIYSYNEAMIKHYFQHPAYGAFPVVGISYEQALDFCKWRTNNNKSKINYKFRLPTKKEWLELANIDLNKKSKNKLKRKQTACQREAENRILCGNFICDSAYNVTALAPIESYYPNAIGAFNVIGNVAELVSEKGIAMGGHFNSDFDEFAIEKEYTYTSQKAWLGFRCVAEIIN